MQGNLDESIRALSVFAFGFTAALAAASVPVSVFFTGERDGASDAGVSAGDQGGGALLRGKGGRCRFAAQLIGKEQGASFGPQMAEFRARDSSVFHG